MMTQHECWLGNLVIFQGTWTSIARNPYTFVIFQGNPDTCPPGSAHVGLDDQSLCTVYRSCIRLLFQYFTSLT